MLERESYEWREIFRKWCIFSSDSIIYLPLPGHDITEWLITCTIISLLFLCVISETVSFHESLCNISWITIYIDIRWSLSFSECCVPRDEIEHELVMCTRSPLAKCTVNMSRVICCSSINLSEELSYSIEIWTRHGEMRICDMCESFSQLFFSCCFEFRLFSFQIAESSF